ncbi:hypothetical protein Hanom_Chr16g01475291 [Helianthus anomalus]
MLFHEILIPIPADSMNQTDLTNESLIARLECFFMFSVSHVSNRVCFNFSLKQCNK